MTILSFDCTTEESIITASTVSYSSAEFERTCGVAEFSNGEVNSWVSSWTYIYPVKKWISSYGSPITATMVKM